MAGPAFGFPVVVKADGLAAGKGVVVAGDRREAEDAVRSSMVDRQFGAAGARLVIEECLSGPEVSYFVIADGERAVPLGTAQDHKRIFDDDRGPNTGGMGAFSPSPLVSPALDDRVMRTIVQPVLEGLRADGHPYRGFLYVGLMLTADGPKVIEFNVRFGDPEAQAVLPLVEGRFARALARVGGRQRHGVAREFQPRPRRGRRARVARLSGDVRVGPRDRRARAGGRVAGRARVPRRHAARRWPGGHGGRPRADGGWARRDLRRGHGARVRGARTRFSSTEMQYRRDIGRKAIDSGRTELPIIRRRHGPH